jgi:hypothetical protein
MTAVLAFLLMLAAVGGMAIGVMFGRKPISGSCGGMKALGLDVECEICGGDPDRCDSAEAPDPVRAGVQHHAPDR